MIDVRQVSHDFNGRWALKNVSFTLEKGEFLFLLGPSGAGKTSLLRLLIAALTLQRGSISVAGYNLNKIRSRTIPLLRRDVSIVFQDFKILPQRTVYHNIAMALEARCMAPRVIERRVRAVARSLHMEDLLDIPCGHLSGGEQQRTAIARSIAVNPQLLLADEPTGNLDNTLAMRLMEVFGQFHSFGTTIILATHNPQLLKAHPKARVLHLKEGQVTAANWPGGRQYRARPAMNGDEE